MANIKKILFASTFGIGIFIILGIIIGFLIALLFIKELGGKTLGTLVKQTGNVITVKTLDGQTKDVELIFKEGSLIKLEGSEENNKFIVDELKLKKINKPLSN